MIGKRVSFEAIPKKWALEPVA